MTESYMGGWTSPDPVDKDLVRRVNEAQRERLGAQGITPPDLEALLAELDTAEDDTIDRVDPGC